MPTNALRNAISTATSKNLVKAFQTKFEQLNSIYNPVVATANHFTGSLEYKDAPLNGVPFLVKEVINVENFATTLGDPSLKRSFASALFTRSKTKDEEAGLVKTLKQNCPPLGALCRQAEVTWIGKYGEIKYFI